MTKMSTVKKSNVSLVASIVAAILATVTAIGLFLGIGNSSDKTETVKASAFTRAAITETGKVVESNMSLVTKNFISTKDMTIELDEDTCSISYQVAFYDEDENFISVTDDLTANFDVANVPENASYFKVMLTPNEVDGEAVKLNVINTSKYIKQLTITYSKE